MTLHKTPAPFQGAGVLSFLFLFQPTFFGAAGDDVADGGDGVDVEHARRAVAHDGADGFAHLWLVAVDAAVGAEGFCFHKRAAVGTGLGLNIARSILDGYGMDYGAESTVGKGSTFWFEMEEAPAEKQ